MGFFSVTDLNLGSLASTTNSEAVGIHHSEDLAVQVVWTNETPAAGSDALTGKVEVQTITFPTGADAVSGDYFAVTDTTDSKWAVSLQKKNVETLRSINRDVSLYTTGDDSLKGKASSPFFIPFNLSLEMDGLSGMRNYERFAITEQILPYSYRSSEQGGVVDFLIKGISHTISNNQWKTKIESLSVSSKRI
jgi:hypothetical protein